MARKVGEPLLIDAQTNNWGRSSYARVCVRLDLSKRLRKGIWIAGNDGRFFQKIEYEGLSSLCFNCGFLGHLAAGCPTRTVSGEPSAMGPAVRLPLNSPATPTASFSKPITNKESNQQDSEQGSNRLSVGGTSAGNLLTKKSVDIVQPPNVSTAEADAGWTLVTRRGPKQRNYHPPNAKYQLRSTEPPLPGDRRAPSHRRGVLDSTPVATSSCSPPSSLAHSAPAALGNVDQVPIPGKQKGKPSWPDSLRVEAVTMKPRKRKQYLRDLGNLDILPDLPPGSTNLAVESLVGGDASPMVDQ